MRLSRQFNYLSRVALLLTATVCIAPPSASQSALRYSAFCTHPLTLHDGTYVSGDRTRTFRVRLHAPFSTSTLRLVFVNWLPSNGGEAANPDTLKVEASVEIAQANPTAQTGPRVAATFNNGSLTAYVAGTQVLYSDPIPISVSTGQDLFVRCSATTAFQGAKFPVTTGLQGRAGEGIAYTDAVDSGSVNITNCAGYGPVEVLAGVTGSPLPSVGLVGDSIIAGAGDVGSEPLTGGRGFAVRAINASLGVVSVAQPGEQAHQYQGSGRAMRMHVTQWCSSIICDYGTNDLNNGFAQLREDILNIAAAYRALGCRFYQCTLLPKTKSTDGFTSVGGQTRFSTEPVRIAFNDWLRDTGPTGFVQTAGGPGVCGVFDTAGAVEVNLSNSIQLNGGYWRAVASTVQAPVAGVAADGSLSAAGVNWSTNAFAGWTVRITSGKGVGQCNYVANSSAYTLHFTQPWAIMPDATSIFALQNAMTMDGTHPTTRAHYALATRVDMNALRQPPLSNFALTGP